MNRACRGPVGTSDPSSGVLRGRLWGAGAACSASGQEAWATCRILFVQGVPVLVGNALWHGVLNGESGVGPAFTSPRSPFCPQTCNASFATRDRLRSHLACHEDKVPCQVCGKYLRAAYMADHLKKHSEGPSNFCSICNRGNLPAVSSRRGAGLRPASGPTLHSHPSRPPH